MTEHQEGQQGPDQALSPVRLRPDNVTPPSRTPWGGRRIAGHYKRGRGLPEDAPIGEAWEISVEPTFPSRLEGSGGSLAERIASDPVAWLGADLAARFGGQLPLLVKLLDAADRLSVQVHPEEGDPDLAPGESGKPEAWIILDADPGAGIYLGFREGVSRKMVELALDRGVSLEPLLNFVPVAPGEVYEVGAGTVHAIGAGVTLVEPQHVTPGLRGVTYRFWDWNRRYDEQGRPDPSGRPRPLQVQRALAVTDWDAPRGAAFVESCRHKPVRIGPVDPGSGQLERWLLIANRHFAAERWQGSGALEIDGGRFRGLLCLGGRLQIAGAGGALSLEQGDCAALPADSGPLRLVGQDAQVVACHSIA
jgi:mannose-6-phosphate isomerase